MLCKGEEVKRGRADIKKHLFICCSKKLFLNEYKIYLVKQI